MRCLGEDYDAAAQLLAEIGFPNLMRWGHYNLLAAMRERLLGRLTDLELQQSNLGELGSVYASLGDNQRAIRFRSRRWRWPSPVATRSMSTCGSRTWVTDT